MQQAEYIVNYILSQNSRVLKSLEAVAKESTVVKTFDGLAFDAKPLRHFDVLKKTILPPKAQVPEKYDMADLKKILKPSIQLSERQKKILSSCFTREISVVDPAVTEIVKNPKLPYLTLQDRRILSTDIVILKSLKNYIKLRTSARNPKSFYLSGPQLMEQILEGKFKYLTRDIMNDLKTTTSLKGHSNSLDFSPLDRAHSLDVIEEETDFPTKKSHHRRTAKERNRNVRDMAVQTEEQYIAPIVAVANPKSRISVDSPKKNKEGIGRVNRGVEEEKERVLDQREASQHKDKHNTVVEPKSRADHPLRYGQRNSSDKDENLSKSGSSRDKLIQDSHPSLGSLASPIMGPEAVPGKSVKVHPTQEKDNLSHNRQQKWNGDHQEERKQGDSSPKINYNPNDDNKALNGRGILDLFKPKKKQVETRDSSTQDQLTRELNRKPGEKEPEVDDSDLVLKQFREALDAATLEQSKVKQSPLHKQPRVIDNRPDVRGLDPQRRDINSSIIFTRLDSQQDNSAIDLLSYQANDKTSDDQWSDIFPASKYGASNHKDDINWKLDTRTHGQRQSAEMDEVVSPPGPGADYIRTGISKKTWSMAPVNDMSKAESKQERNRDLHRNFVDGLKRRRRLGQVKRYHQRVENFLLAIFVTFSEYLSVVLHYMCGEHINIFVLSSVNVGRRLIL